MDVDFNIDGRRKIQPPAGALGACKGFSSPNMMAENLQILTQAALASRESRGGV